MHEVYPEKATHTSDAFLEERKVKRADDPNVYGYAGVVASTQDAALTDPSPEASTEEEEICEIRMFALQKAVEVLAHSSNVDEIVSGAEKFVTFLKGD